MLTGLFTESGEPWWLSMQLYKYLLLYYWYRRNWRSITDQLINWNKQKNTRHACFVSLWWDTKHVWSALELRTDVRSAWVRSDLRVDVRSACLDSNNYNSWCQYYMQEGHNRTTHYTGHSRVNYTVYRLHTHYKKDTTVLHKAVDRQWIKVTNTSVLLHSTIM